MEKTGFERKTGFRGKLPLLAGVKNCYSQNSPSFHRGYRSICLFLFIHYLDCSKGGEEGSYLNNGERSS